MHLLGWSTKRHSPIPCLLLARMNEYAAFATAHHGYESTLGLPDRESRVAAERRYYDSCPMASEYVELIKSREGQAWLEEKLR